MPGRVVGGKSHFAVFCVALSLGLAEEIASAQSGRYTPPPSHRSLEGLSSQVDQLAANDRQQDLRLSHLEKDVSQLHRTVAAAPAKPKTSGGSVESGSSPAPKLVPYTTYEVRKGDTLWRIAMNHRVSPGDIMTFNRMPNDTVQTGQVLMIPQRGAGQSPPPAPAAQSSMHEVAQGETFYSIAQKHKVSVDALTKANPGVDPLKLRPGLRLVIPGQMRQTRGGTAAAPQMAYDYGLPAGSKASAQQKHTVAPGESLSGIASKYHVSMAAIQQANGITDPNKLEVGRMLTIPGSSAVAAKGTSVPKPASPSPSTPASVPPPTPSQPAGPPPASTAAPATPPPDVHRGVVAYRMDGTDTVDSVAKTFGTTAAEIRRLNKLGPTTPLQAGDEILVPAMGASPLK